MLSLKQLMITESYRGKADNFLFLKKYKVLDEVYSKYQVSWIC